MLLYFLRHGYSGNVLYLYYVVFLVFIFHPLAGSTEFASSNTSSSPILTVATHSASNLPTARRAPLLAGATATGAKGATGATGATPPAGPPPLPSSGRMGLLLALYNANVTTDWKTVGEAAHRIPLRATVPVPGVVPPDPDWAPLYPSASAYRAGVAALRSAGVQVGAYIHLRNVSIPCCECCASLSQVQKWVAHTQQMADFDAVMYDNMDAPWSAYEPRPFHGLRNLYEPAVRVARAANLMVWANGPHVATNGSARVGADTWAPYLNLTDLTTLFEMRLTNWSQNVPPGVRWNQDLGVPASKLGGYVLSVPPESSTDILVHIVRTARARGLRWLYPAPACKHSNGPHAGSCTYADLPAYWGALVDAVEIVNREIENENEKSRFEQKVVVVVGEEGGQLHVHERDPGQSLLSSPSCVGYRVSGAGSADYDGCYILPPPPPLAAAAAAAVVVDVATNNTIITTTPVPIPTLYRLDATHELYSWEGTWRLGQHGVKASYIASNPSNYPPVSAAGGCGNGWVPYGSGTSGGGQPPCPAIIRSNLPPTPPQPPPPPPPPIPAPPAPPMRLVWTEDFNGEELNASRWNVLEQVHRGGVYTRDNVLLRDGSLVLRTVPRNLTINQNGRPTPFYVASGGVNTSGLAQQQRGRWEVVVKLPRVALSSGYTLHSSIWLFADQNWPSNSGCPQEIDVVEQYVLGMGNQSRAVANIHPFLRNNSVSSSSSSDGDSSSSSNSELDMENVVVAATNVKNVAAGGQCNKVPWSRSTKEGARTAMGDWTSTWTNFTVDWTKNWISMRVNGQPYAYIGGDTNAKAVNTFTDSLFLALTACVMERVPVQPDHDTFPLEYLIDKVNVYEYI